MAKVRNRHIRLLDGEKLILGSSGDHEIYWDGTSLVGILVSGLDQLGTDSASWQIDADNSGPKFIWNGFTLLLRNQGDSDDADFKCRDLVCSQDFLPTRFHRGVQSSGSLISSGNLNPTSYLNVAVTTGNETTITSFTTVGAAAGQFCFIRNELAEPITVVPGATIVTPDGNNHTIEPNGSMLIQFRSSYWTVVGTKPDPVKGVNDLDLPDGTAVLTINSTNSGEFLTIDSTTEDISIYVPTNSVDTLPIGFYFDVLQKGGGNAVITPDGSGVEVEGANGLQTKQQWSVIRVTKVETDLWVVSGDAKS